MSGVDQFVEGYDGKATVHVAVHMITFESEYKAGQRYQPEVLSATVSTELEGMEFDVVLENGQSIAGLEEFITKMAAKVRASVVAVILPADKPSADQQKRVEEI